MGDDVVIRAENLGKQYVIGHRSERPQYVALRDVLAQAPSNLWRGAVGLARGRGRGSGENREPFWALRDVSFEVKRGEVVGVIGRNGAGKSTLLKILSRITEPSCGRVTIRGRVASLLEVGTGFHPELTGRQNIFLNGAILGMSRAEIRRKFDEIVDFSDVETFLDTPVKRYSTGMYLRLAFAVAAHMEPEILIVDEVLAVGDAEFQRKCLGKMDDVAHSGRTVLFVSHNMTAAAELCNHGLLLSGGRVLVDADMATTVLAYTRQTSGLHASALNVLIERADAPIREHGLVTRVEMLDRSKRPVSTVPSNGPVTFRVWYNVSKILPQGSVVIMLKGPTDVTLAKFETDPQHLALLCEPGEHHVDCQIEHLPLMAGHYFVGAGLAHHRVKLIDWVEGDAPLVVAPSEDPDLDMGHAPVGPLAMRHRWMAGGSDAPAPGYGAVAADASR